MSLLVGLGPLLDASAILTIARQFWSARSRLSLHTNGQLPSAAEFPIAFRLYVNECDRQRLHTSFPSNPSSPQPTLSQLRLFDRYLILSDSVYAESDQNLRARLLSLDITNILFHRRLAEKWKPGYAVCHDPSDDTLLIIIRGSQEVSDFVTNLSADTEPFLTGYGHQGVIRSAYDIATTILPLLSTANTPSRVVILGHSLGAAVASALTILLHERGVNLPNSISPTMKQALQGAKCYAFAPPPFASECVARTVLTNNISITTFVMGWDIVPRLSAASLERLLIQVSRFDWGGALGRGMMRMVGFGDNETEENEEERGNEVMERAMEEHAVTGLAAASTLVGSSAQAAFSSRRESNGMSFWGTALGTTALVARFVGSQLNQSRNRLADLRERERRRGEMSMAEVFGMNADEVNRVIGDGPAEVFLVGNVWHLERRFEEISGRDFGQGLEEIRFVKKEKEEMKDIEASNWMVHDHTPKVMLRALERLIEIEARQDR